MNKSPTNTEIKPIGKEILQRYLEGEPISLIAEDYSVNDLLVIAAILDTLEAIREQVKLR